jgi:hypothetical protein
LDDVPQIYRNEFVLLELGYLYEPFPDSELIATPVSTVVNNAKHEGPD